MFGAEIHTSAHYLAAFMAQKAADGIAIRPHSAHPTRTGHGRHGRHGAFGTAVPLADRGGWPWSHATLTGFQVQLIHLV